MAQQINKIIKNSEFKDELITRGLQRASEFSLVQTATKTLAVILSK